MTGPKLWQQFTIQMIVPSKAMNAFLRKMRVLSPRRQTMWDSRVLALCVLITSMAVGAVGVPASATDDVIVRAVDALMLCLMSKYNVLGLALALIKNGRIVMEKGYGFRDLQTQDPVTTETLFNIGSISKSFTALGIVQLVDEHKVNLDTPIIKYLPDLRLSDSQLTRTVAFRQLLSHTSGLPADEKWPRQVPPTRREVIGEFATMPITTQLGTKFQYCSPCVVLAAYVLERMADQTVVTLVGIPSWSAPPAAAFLPVPHAGTLGS